jgi:hypothetical protein
MSSFSTSSNRVESKNGGLAGGYDTEDLGSFALRFVAKAALSHNQWDPLRGSLSRPMGAMGRNLPFAKPL